MYTRCIHRYLIPRVLVLDKVIILILKSFYSNVHCNAQKGTWTFNCWNHQFGTLKDPTCWFSSSIPEASQIMLNQSRFFCFCSSIALRPGLERFLYMSH
ncbi:MAG: hypothetical protein [Circular genetic element sp.]|nr:MAG: hypothetical protein [Circular genetic element sp.]